MSASLTVTAQELGMITRALETGGTWRERKVLSHFFDRHAELSEEEGLWLIAALSNHFDDERIGRTDGDLVDRIQHAYISGGSNP